MNTRPAQHANAYTKKYQMKLVPIPRGQKGPIREGWNKPGGYIEDPEAAQKHWLANPDEGIGCVLGASGLCSLDLDNVELAREVLSAFGVDIDTLAATYPTVVGNPARFRILFAAPQAVALTAHKLSWPRKEDPSKTLHLFEMRAGPVQDVLPPSVHPSTGQEYTWKTRPNGRFLELPESLLTLWRDWPNFESQARAMCPWAPAPTLPARHGESVIEIFNERVQVEQVLERNGYKRKGKKYLAPGSETGLAGVVIFDNGRCFSHHGNDTLADQHAHDAFDVFRILEHAGDFKAAAKAAAQELGLERQRSPASPSSTQTGKASVGLAGAIVVRVADVKAEPIQWLWPARIALGKLSLIAGDPGQGKSLLTLAIAAHVSTGSPWPVDRSACPRGDVLLLSAEDDIADTIRPRLDAAGAEVSRIKAMTMVRDIDQSTGEIRNRGFSLRRDLSYLAEELALNPGYRLVVVDPVSAYLDGADSHNNADIRGLLAPLAELATKFKVAFVAVTHLNKGTGGNAMYRATGSLAFVAAARSVLAVTKDKEDPSRRLVLPVKNNLGTDQTGLAYQIGVASNGAPVVQWEPDPVTVTADEALASTNQEDGEDSAKTEAEGWLRDQLEGGDLDGKRIKDLAKDAGISERTLYRASKAIGVKTISGGFGRPRTWHLCPMSAKKCHVCQPQNGGTHEEVGTHDAKNRPLPQVIRGDSESVVI